MTPAMEILTELQRRGVTVAVDGDTLRLKPRRALDDAVLARVREMKPAILEALRQGQCEGLSACGLPHCAGCYDVDPESRAKFHPPKCGEEYRKWLEHWQPKGKPQ